MTEHEQTAAVLRDLAVEVRSLAHSNGNGKTKLLTMDTLIKLVLVAAVVILSYQKMQDRQDFLDGRMHDMELWRDTERQLVVSHDRRLTVLETRTPDPPITVRRR